VDYSSLSSGAGLQNAGECRRASRRDLRRIELQRRRDLFQARPFKATPSSSAASRSPHTVTPHAGGGRALMPISVRPRGGRGWRGVARV